VIYKIMFLTVYLAGAAAIAAMFAEMQVVSVIAMVVSVVAMLGTIITEMWA